MTEHQPTSRDRAPGIVKIDGDRSQHLFERGVQVQDPLGPDIALDKVHAESRRNHELFSGPYSPSHGLWHEPMSRDRQGGLRSRYMFSNASPDLGVFVVQHGIHWVTVSEENRRHCERSGVPLDVFRLAYLIMFVHTTPSFITLADLVADTVRSAICLGIIWMETSMQRGITRDQRTRFDAFVIASINIQREPWGCPKLACSILTVITPR